MGDYDEAMKKAGEQDTLMFKAKKIQILYEKQKYGETKELLASITESDKKGNI